MPIAKYNSLRLLISSLSKSEKRNFKVYSHRFANNKEGLFMKLFDLVERYPKLNESGIIEKMPDLKSVQFANLKRHLFLQVLKSLRATNQSKSIELKTYEKFDYSKILESKSMTSEAYDMVNRIGELDSMPFLNLQKLELEQRFLEQNRPIIFNNERYKSLGSEIERCRYELLLDWQISDWFKESKMNCKHFKYARNAREMEFVEQANKAKASIIAVERLNPTQKLMHYKIKQLYYKMICDFDNMQINASKYFKEISDSTNLYSDEDLILSNTIQSIFYKIEVNYIKDEKKEIQSHFNVLQNSFPTLNKLVGQSELQYCYLVSMLRCKILTNSFQDFGSIAMKIENELIEYRDRMDPQELIEIHFYLATAWIHKGHYEKGIEILTMLINSSHVEIDVLLYSRLIRLFCHYRLRNFDLISNLLPGLRTAFVSNGLMTKSLDMTFILFRKGIKALDFGMKDFIDNYSEKMNNYKSIKYENIPFLYFDFITWFESIKFDVSVEKYKSSQ